MNQNICKVLFSQKKKKNQNLLVKLSPAFVLQLNCAEAGAQQQCSHLAANCKLCDNQRAARETCSLLDRQPLAE